MQDTCVINYASGWFVRGQQRIFDEFRKVGYKGDFLLYNDDHPLQCPSHGQVPYGFKPYAMKEAQKKGYRYLLWCDASVFPEKPVEPVFDIIKNLGYFFHENGWNSGEWCCDAALQPLGITREESFAIPHLIGGCQGIDLGTENGRKYLDQYYERANDGLTFPGPYTNENGQASPDKRVRGHRHDQTAASVIAWKLGMRQWQKNIIIYDPAGNTPRKPETIFLVRSA